MMRLDDFRYSDIGCGTHIADDNSTNCCLSKVQRWGFSFAKYCLDERFDMISGKHYPTTIERVVNTEKDVDDLITNASESFQRLTLQVSTFSCTTNMNSSLSSNILCDPLNTHVSSVNSQRKQPNRPALHFKESTIDGNSTKIAESVEETDTDAITVASIQALASWVECANAHDININ